MASIFSLFGTIFIDNAEADKSIDTTTEKAEKSGSKVGSAFSSIAKGAAAMGTAVVAGAAAIGTAAYKMASDTAAAADEVDKTSQKLGMSKTAYQEWDYVLSQSGVEITSMTTGLKTLTNKIDDAKDVDLTPFHTLAATEKMKIFHLSAKTGEGCEELKDALLCHFAGEREETVILPYEDGAALAAIHREKVILKKEETEEGLRITYRTKG